MENVSYKNENIGKKYLNDMQKSQLDDFLNNNKKNIIINLRVKSKE